MTESSEKALSPLSERSSRFLIVVESDINDLFYISALLQWFEYNIYTAKTGEEAFELSNVVTPALIITELALIDMSGLELIMRLKHEQHTARIPIIVKNADNSAENERRCLHAGACALIRNPVQAEELYRAVQAAIETTPRKNIRIPVRISVSVNDVPLDILEGEYISVLSEQGMHIRMLKPYIAKSAISVQFTIKGRIIDVQARVIYHHTFKDGPSKPPGMGIQFTQITQQNTQLIQQFINEEINKGFKVPS